MQQTILYSLDENQLIHRRMAIFSAHCILLLNEEKIHSYITAA